MVLLSLKDVKRIEINGSKKSKASAEKKSTNKTVLILCSPGLCLEIDGFAILIVLLVERPSKL